jgi:hypothetical protein
MLSQNKGLIENFLLGLLVSSSVATIFGLATNQTKFAVPGSMGVAGSIMLWRESNRNDNLKQLQEDSINLSKVSAELTHAQSLLTGFRTEDGTLIDIDAQKRLIERLEANLSQSEARLRELAEKEMIAKGECKSLEMEKESLEQRITSLEDSKAAWEKEFNNQSNEHTQELKAKDSEITKLNETLNEQNKELVKYQAQFNSVDELAKLRANSELHGITDELEKVKKAHTEKMAEYIKLGNLYNSLKAEYQTDLAKYQKEFAYLSDEGFKEAETSFNAELSDRDRMLLAASARLSELESPHKFEQVGEYTRADKLIDALYHSDSRIVLDASEIVPIDYSRFEAYFNLRDRKSRGKAMIESLNAIGEEIHSQLSCIKPIKFEFDPVNPHRIKATFVHKVQKTEPKSNIDKLWIPAEQFAAKIPKLLKKPMTRVMGSTGEGKGIFVNLLLAVEANSSQSAHIRLHDPMDGSSQDYWNIPKTSKGASETKTGIQRFVTEFNERLESGISEPKTLDVFDEVDIVADNDSSINKELLKCSKGMRHNGMRAYIIGQSPSVGKKGWEWADMDNFNAVYFGTSIITAINKTPVLETRSDTLKKEYDKLSKYCQEQNNELGLEGWNEYRFGLLVTGGKTFWFELPNADSIPCDWSKLTEVSKTETKINLPVTCQHSSYRVRKTYKDEQGNAVKQYRKCKDCDSNFTVDL